MNEVFKFLKESLTRKYGEDWYKELTIAGELLEAKNVAKAAKKATK